METTPATSAEGRGRGERAAGLPTATTVRSRPARTPSCRSGGGGPGAVQRYRSLAVISCGMILLGNRRAACLRHQVTAEANAYAMS